MWTLAILLFPCQLRAMLCYSQSLGAVNRNILFFKTMFYKCFINVVLIPARWKLLRIMRMALIGRLLRGEHSRTRVTADEQSSAQTTSQKASWEFFSLRRRRRAMNVSSGANSSLVFF